MVFRRDILWFNGLCYKKALKNPVTTLVLQVVAKPPNLPAIGTISLTLHGSVPWAGKFELPGGHPGLEVSCVMLWAKGLSPGEKGGRMLPLCYAALLTHQLG